MFNVALAGGCIIGRPFSDCADPRFLAIINVLRSADVSFAHLEGTIAEKDDPEVFPAAEGGWTWIRMPAGFGEELKWAGFDIVSHASNHSLDYMYGGLYSTWNALRQSRIPFAGTGMSLAEARAPAYLETAKARVALVSSSSSTTNWARASNPVRDDRPRPGVNQIRTLCKLGADAMKTVRDLAVQMGWWVTEVGREIVLNPAGLHNTVTRYLPSEKPGVTIIADPDDVNANLRMIREAKGRADFVIFHVHNHEWNPQESISSPPDFIRSLARDCIDAGADIVIAEGAHALVRGIEIYRGKPIFYDPGDLFKDGNSKNRPLSEYYWLGGRPSGDAEWRVATVDTTDCTELQRFQPAANPPGGYSTGRVAGLIVPVCGFNDAGELQEITLYPVIHLSGSFALRGLPGLATDKMAHDIIEYVGELSAPFGTKIQFADGVGHIDLSEHKTNGVDERRAASGTM